MKAKLDEDDARAFYRKRKQAVDFVFGIIKNLKGFTRFHLRGIHNVVVEWTIVTLACNCRCINRMLAA